MAIYDRLHSAFVSSGGVVAPDRLTNEVVEQILTPTLTSITDAPPGAEDVCRFDFDGTLDATGEALLDSVVAAHDGTPLPEPGPEPTSHDALIGVMADQHHPRLHASSHFEGEGDALRDFQLAVEEHYKESEGNSSTAGTALVSKVGIKEDLSEGLYRIEWYAEVWHSAWFGETRVAVVMNGASYVALTDVPQASRYAEVPVSGFKIIELREGSHSFEMQFAQGGGSAGTAYIRRARLLVKKVRNT